MKPTKKIFLFLYFSFRSPHRYPQHQGGYTQSLSNYPQFKKVFSYFRVKIHTSCAQRFRQKYFVGMGKPQNAVWLHPGLNAMSRQLSEDPSTVLLEDGAGQPEIVFPVREGRRSRDQKPVISGSYKEGKVNEKG
jgi:hypothetical protein